jgi:hypothetical protein
MATYELWDDRTGQSIGRWSNQRSALAAVIDLLDRGEVVAIAALILRRSDWRQPATTIASGSELVHLAQNAQPEGWPSPGDRLP